MKEKRITFRVTEEEFVKIQWNAKANNQTVTGYIRNVALNDKTGEETQLQIQKVYTGLLELYQMAEKLERNAVESDNSYTEIREKVEDITYDLLQNSKGW